MCILSQTKAPFQPSKHQVLLTITNSFGRSRWKVLLGAALWAWGGALAQQYTPPPPPLTTAPCVPTKKDPCTVPPVAPPPADKKFAFPGDAPPGDKAAPPKGAGAPVGAAAPGGFAFPGEPEDKPAPATPVGAPKGFAFPDDASSSSSSSSSNSADADPSPDTDKPALADTRSAGSTRAKRRHLPKVEDMGDREAKDLEVSRYYASTGNFQASYMRAKDAVATVPEDPLAHFAVAEAARLLKKDGEAMTEYRLYLKLDPEGEKAKASERALDQLAAKQL